MDEFATHSNIRWNGHVGVVEYGGGDRGQVAMFFNKPIQDKLASVENGRPVFKDQAFIRIHPPGERLNIVERPVQENDKRRFPVQWAQFQQNQEQRPEGTPIDMLYPEHPSIGAMFRAHRVFTVEMCAELSAAAIDEIGMGCQRHVNFAQKFLQQAQRGVATGKMRKELEERDREINVLKRQVEELTSTLHSMQAQQAQMPDLAQVQSMMAGLMQRPVHMPKAAFDPQTAQINATSPTRLVADAKKPGARAGRGRSLPKIRA